MSKILIVFIVGLFLIGVVGIAYYGFVGIGRPFSSHGQDWAQFGDYFGGVAGALLSFLSILLLVYTIHLQSEQLLQARWEARKRDQLAHVTKADDEIMHWLGRKIAILHTKDETIEFGDVVWGLLAPDYVNPKEFQVATERLLKLTCLYCEALDLYRTNVDPYFIFKYHRQKAQTLLDFLNKHQSQLNPMAGPSLMLCQKGINGEFPT